MKAEDLIDTLIGEPKSRIVVELGNRHRVFILDYIHELDQRGDQIILLLAKGNKKIKKKPQRPAGDRKENEIPLLWYE